MKVEDFSTLEFGDVVNDAFLVVERCTRCGQVIAQWEAGLEVTGEETSARAGEHMLKVNEHWKRVHRLLALPQRK